MSQKQTQLLLILIVAICLCSTGCSMQSIKIKGNNENLLDQANAVQPTYIKRVYKTSNVPVMTGSVGDKDSIDEPMQPDAHDLIASLNQYGYNLDYIDPTYEIKGTYVMGLGSNIGVLIAWDILMAVPSIVLPVPLMGSYTYKLDITITDMATETLLGQIKETLDYSLTGFSVWGLAGKAGYVHEDMLSVAAMLIDEELKRIYADKQSILREAKQ